MSRRQKQLRDPAAGIATGEAKPRTLNVSRHVEGDGRVARVRLQLDSEAARGMNAFELTGHLHKLQQERWKPRVPVSKAAVLPRWPAKCAASLVAPPKQPGKSGA